MKITRRRKPSSGEINESMNCVIARGIGHSVGERPIAGAGGPWVIRGKRLPIHISQGPRVNRAADPGDVVSRDTTSRKTSFYPAVLHRGASGCRDRGDFAITVIADGPLCIVGQNDIAQINGWAPNAGKGMTRIRILELMYARRGKAGE